MPPDRPTHTCPPRPLDLARLMIMAGLVLLATSLATLATTTGGEAAPSAGPAAQGGPDGATVFQARCTGCHTIGGGTLVGPDLKDVGKRRTAQWLKSFISDPPTMIDTDPTAQALKKQFSVTMPKLGLSPAEVDALVTFLGNPGTLPSAGAGAAAAGDAGRGRRIYRGEQALANGGPACIACHAVSGASRLNGGGLGPDLTHVAGRMGTAGLTSALTSIAFPTMAGPFGDHPLTPQEVADLVAFLNQASASQAEGGAVAPGSPTRSALTVFGLGAAGTALLFGVMLIFWPRQRKSLASQLRGRAQSALRKP